MLLANLSKSPAIERLISLERPKVSELTPSKRAITQLIELFNQGISGGWNKDATYDYLAYVFADLAKVKLRCQMGTLMSVRELLMDIDLSIRVSSHI